MVHPEVKSTNKMIVDSLLSPITALCRVHYIVELIYDYTNSINYNQKC